MSTPDAGFDVVLDVERAVGLGEGLAFAGEVAGVVGFGVSVG
jgi:hypothetical protein